MTRIFFYSYIFLAAVVCKILFKGQHNTSCHNSVLHLNMIIYCFSWQTFATTRPQIGSTRLLFSKCGLCCHSVVTYDITRVYCSVGHCLNTIMTKETVDANEFPTTAAPVRFGFKHSLTSEVENLMHHPLHNDSASTRASSIQRCLLWVSSVYMNDSEHKGDKEDARPWLLRAILTSQLVYWRSSCQVTERLRALLKITQN